MTKLKAGYYSPEEIIAAIKEGRCSRGTFITSDLEAAKAVAEAIKEAAPNQELQFITDRCDKSKVH